MLDDKYGIDIRHYIVHYTYKLFGTLCHLRQSQNFIHVHEYNSFQFSFLKIFYFNFDDVNLELAVSSLRQVKVHVLLTITIDTNEH